MCLTTITNELTAKTDILVYKCLDFDGDIYCTPFRYMPVEFNNGRVELKSELIKIGKDCVEIGIHSYFNKNDAITISRSFHANSGTSMHYAIIPKGSRYYVGKVNDIASTKLIIFRTKKSFDTYCKTHLIEKIEIQGKNIVNIPI